MELIKGFDSNYRYILVAARRARQIQSGAPALVKTTSRKACRVARDEIRAGLIEYAIQPLDMKSVEPAGDHVFNGGGH